MRSKAWLLMALSTILTATQCRNSDTGSSEHQLGGAPFLIAEGTLTIPQVDYEPAIYYDAGDPHPHLDFSQVDAGRIVDKEHVALFLENSYIRLTLLPELGRVYALYYKPTGHDELWRNDTVTVGGALNDAGWWMWIGGVEYTLPGDEHGTTWSTPWTWQVLEDSPGRKTVRLEVKERGTSLRERIDLSIYPEKAYYETAIRISNPTDDTVRFAHWVNPQWAPGGRNELTDSTEFIIPTDRILIAEKWQQNMGPSPQEWADNRLRFIRGWDKMGDLMADGLSSGFYGAHSHDTEEGIVRVFDREKTPGVDVWTYGYRPERIPMGSGSPSRGYVEMWGGTSKLYPDERQPLAPEESLEWIEWMYPYHGTGGLTVADTAVAVSFRSKPDGSAVTVGLCPTGRWQGTIELWASSDVVATADPAPLRQWHVDLTPTNPFFESISLTDISTVALSDLELQLRRERGNTRAIALEGAGSRQ
ncbi:MAG: DUF5107 domain-containing protein [Gemmatimonadota bacterium]|nr:MAG: DUF5107 domain-containing protein [Gemmatimonadota bacterium]